MNSLTFFASKRSFFIRSDKDFSVAKPAKIWFTLSRFFYIDKSISNRSEAVLQPSITSSFTKSFKTFVTKLFMSKYINGIMGASV